MLFNRIQKAPINILFKTHKIRQSTLFHHYFNFCSQPPKISNSENLHIKNSLIHSQNSPKTASSQTLSNSSLPASRLNAYLRLIRYDKQIGTLLLLLPSYFSILIACPPTLYTLYISSLFTVGALAARSAGCIINDYWDMDIDKHVERTKSRPLTTGEVSKTEALALFGSLTAGCFGIA